MTLVAVLVGCGGSEPRPEGAEAAAALDEGETGALDIAPGPHEATTAPAEPAPERLAYVAADEEIPIATIVLRQESDTESQLYFFSEEVSCRDVRGLVTEREDLVVAVTGMDRREMRPELPTDLPPGEWSYRVDRQVRTAAADQGRVTITDVSRGGDITTVGEELDHVQGVVQFEVNADDVVLRGPFEALVCDTTLTGA